jgi:hypothetical protein
VFTSDLSVSEYVLLGEAGFEPLGFVVGSSIYHWEHPPPVRSVMCLVVYLQISGTLARSKIGEAKGFGEDPVHHRPLDLPRSPNTPHKVATIVLVSDLLRLLRPMEPEG